MLPALRFLSSRPRAAVDSRKWRIRFVRERSASAGMRSSQTGFWHHEHLQTNRGHRRLDLGPRERPPSRLSRPLQPQYHFANNRTPTAFGNEVFIPWLTRRLELLIDTSKDPGFSEFASNLVSALQSKNLQHSLDKEDGGIARTSEWIPKEHSKPLHLLKSLKQAARENGPFAVDAQLKYSYHGLIAGRAFSQLDLSDQEKLADLRYPVEWYSETRTMQRTIHLHVGPTNSGKTYHALKALEQANSGIYAGPLRLLAHEIYTRLNAKGKPCDLVTGDEQIHTGGEEDRARMMSCTVEMVPLNIVVDVAIIDEIQMIGSQDRGWAWTQALLGVLAKELHLTGEERTVPLIREIVASMGDKLEIHNYKRLSPLKAMSNSLHGRLSDLRKGDCIVVFSRIGIHTMKTAVERATQKRVAIVYGSLPPEIRAQQARLFNEPDNDYDFLVASDAIGMGLNLAIKRIVFETTVKFDGKDHVPIEANQIKQIAGRAGRFRTAAQDEGVSGNDIDKSPTSVGKSQNMPIPNLGLVTTLYEEDLPQVRKCMVNEPDPIMSAGILPPTAVIAKFATYFPPSTSFSYILLRLHEISLLHPRFHLCTLKDQIGIADTIQPIKNLTVEDRIALCAAPASAREPGMANILFAFAKCIGENASGALLDIPEVPLDILDEKLTIDKNYMYRLESLHKALILYLWLTYRFSAVFISQPMAFYAKRLVEGRLDKLLAEYSSSPAIRKRIQKMQRDASRKLGELEATDAIPNQSEQQNEMTEEPLLPLPEPLENQGLEEQAEAGVLQNIGAVIKSNDRSIRPQRAFQ